MITIRYDRTVRKKNVRNYTQNERTTCTNREMLARRMICPLIMKSSTSIFIIQNEFYDSRHQCEKENECLNVSKHLTIPSSYLRNEI